MNDKQMLTPGTMITVTSDELIVYLNIVEKCRNVIISFDKAPPDMLITRDITSDVEKLRSEIMNVKKLML